MRAAPAVRTIVAVLVHCVGVQYSELLLLLLLLLFSH